MNNLKKIISLMLVLSVVIIIACIEEMPNPITDKGAPHYTDLESAKLVAGGKNQAILLDFYTNW